MSTNQSGRRLSTRPDLSHLAFFLLLATAVPLVPCRSSSLWRSLRESHQGLVHSLAASWLLSGPWLSPRYPSDATDSGAARNYIRAGDVGPESSFHHSFNNSLEQSFFLSPSHSRSQLPSFRFIFQRTLFNTPTSITSSFTFHF